MDRRGFCRSMTGMAALAAMRSAANAQEGTTRSEAARYDIPGAWRHSGLVLQRSMEGPGSGVVGDPCVVRDDDIDAWRMFLFFEPPGCGHAVCPQGLDPTPGHWRLEGPLGIHQPNDISGGFTHKPYVVMMRIVQTMPPGSMAATGW